LLYFVGSPTVTKKFDGVFVRFSVRRFIVRF
jgi:hypothetical protein